MGVQSKALDEPDPNPTSKIDFDRFSNMQISWFYDFFVFDPNHARWGFNRKLSASPTRIRSQKSIPIYRFLRLAIDFLYTPFCIDQYVENFSLGVDDYGESIGVIGFDQLSIINIDNWWKLTDPLDREWSISYNDHFLANVSVQQCCVSIKSIIRYIDYR